MKTINISDRKANIYNRRNDKVSSTLEAHKMLKKVDKDLVETFNAQRSVSFYNGIYNLKNILIKGTGLSFGILLRVIENKCLNLECKKCKSCYLYLE